MRDHRAAVVGILADFGFTDVDNVRLLSISKPGYPDGDQGRRTILVEVRGQAPPSFAPARDELVNYFQSTSIPSIDIEIIHDHAFRPCLFPIDPTHPAIPIFENMKQALLAELQRQIPSQWTMTTLLQVGRHREHADPTIVVMVRPGSLFDWSLLRASLKRLWSDADARRLLIDLEILPGGFSNTDNDEFPGPNISQEDRFNDEGKLSMGSSIGDAAGKRVGTLGGFVSLAHKGRIYKCAMTNYHVTRPSSEDEQKAANMSGCDPSTNNAAKTDLVFFASMDAKNTQERLEGSQDDWGQQQKRTVELIERQQMKGGEGKDDEQKTGRLVNYREYVKERLDQTQRMIDLVRSMPRELGKVLCSSGAGIWHGRVHDWALVELSDDALPLFSLNEMPEVARADTPLKYLNQNLYALTGKPLSGFGELQLGQWYLRVGRTSTSAGISNGTRVCLNWSESIRYNLEGKEVDMVGTVTEEHIIFNTPLAGGGKFGLPGDSGSWLIDRSAQVCGLYYGNTSKWVAQELDNEQNAGIAMSFPEVVKGIKMKLGDDNAELALL